MHDREVEKELERAHELSMAKLIAKATVVVLAILIGCPTAVCVHRDWQKAQLGRGEWSNVAP